MAYFGQNPTNFRNDFQAYRGDQFGLCIPPGFESVVDKKFICPVCDKVMANTHQADDCGCRFCFECLKELHNAGVKKCPSCKQNFESPYPIKDRYFQQKLDQVVVSCPIEGCTQTRITLGALKRHWNSHFRPVPVVQG